MTRERRRSLRRTAWSLLLAGTALSGCARSLPEPQLPAERTPPGTEEAPPPAAGAPEPPAISPAEPLELPAPEHPRRFERLLRVGLATDLDRVTLPEHGDVDLIAAGSLLTSSVPITVRPAAPAPSGEAFRVQVAALKDEGQAEELARRVEARLEGPAEAVFDAAIDLYRVRVGRFETRAAAERLRQRLVGLGLSASWVVGEMRAEVEEGLLIEQGERTISVPGRWVRFHRREGILRHGGHRYRGDLLVYLNDRGSLNLINELPVEEYLRGVVPREMGPLVFDRLEALKAQAVAARTYVLRNRGEFVGEGYDICATPRCQVYGGLEAEQPLTDRAVEETGGEVLVWGEQLVDALYSSTCGGHTENVEVVFPLKRHPYLRGVPCVEGHPERLPSRLGETGEFPAALVEGLLGGPEPATTPTAAAEARLRRLATLAGLPLPDDRLRSLERRELQRFLASLFDLAIDARLFVSEADISYLLADMPSSWSAEERELATWLLQSGLAAPPGDAVVEATELDHLLLRLALYLRVLEERTATFVSFAAGHLTTRDGAEETTWRLESAPLAYRLFGDRARAAPLQVLPGDRLRLYLEAGRPLAIVHEVDLDGAAADRTSSFSHWSRFRTDEAIAAAAAERYPGFRFLDFEILGRGESGRVAAIRLHGDEGRTEHLEGLAIRWLFDVPDTLFTARRLTPPERSAGWLFTGRGWGHGVGMCQIGAYGMAARGRSYREILAHYYTGVEIRRVEYE